LGLIDLCSTSGEIDEISDIVRLSPGSDPKLLPTRTRVIRTVRNVFMTPSLTRGKEPVKIIAKDWLGFIEVGDNSLCAIVPLKESEMSSQ
jgi:hypothetical protein